MPLDPIMDTRSEDRHSASSLAHLDDDGKTPPALSDSDGEDFEVFSTANGSSTSEGALYRRIWS
jgi:hypothetical protein